MIGDGLHRTGHRNLLTRLHINRSEFHLARVNQDSLDRSQSKVVVRAEFKLLVEHLKQVCDLEGQGPRIREAIAVKDDLGDDHDIGHDHGDRSEQCFQIVRQRCSAHKERVHGDERGTVALEFQHSAINCDIAYPGSLGTLDDNNMLRNDGQDVYL